MSRTVWVCGLLGIVSTAYAGSFEWVDDPKAGTLTLRDGGKPVLTYCYGDQIKEGIDPKYTRSCYVHPLYDLDGKPMTDDFPADHKHHRGVWWTWPRMTVRGKAVQTWHPCNPPLRQYFVKWLKQEAGEKGATLSVQNETKLADEQVGLETVTVAAHPADETGRAIDVTLIFEAVGGPITLLGADKKGYGGLCVRLDPSLKGATMTTDAGAIDKDSMNKPFKWADISAGGRGVAVFVPPDHPDYPPTWLLRASYGGILNVSWPGLTPFTLEPGKPLTLRYRLYVHRGDVESGKVKEAFGQAVFP
ncbi:MAG: PmoA family protein [Planctomycetota bacterium]